ncbi:hypothetical protein J437_LFUL001224 [Ladona fulva]|uniref:C2H2-type domain-containing protein n=1 Tax=Ladona fulva TaxID=123851 RepID=A0A8K0JVY0_LADFU|nr:hypothetical protein J437_LFUL001224 [Ladona fulva]
MAKFVSGRKRFLCPFCAKAFRTKSQMMLHRSLHTGDLPYPCEVCGKRFPLRCRLLRHMSVHDASITCEFCGMDFKTNILLGRHIKARHTIPSYTYAPVNTQPQPVANKSGQRFPCRLCPKVFSTVNGLKVHKRVHVNTTVKIIPLSVEKEKPEEKTAVSLQDTCKICGMSFPNALYLKSHMVCHNIIRPNSGKLMSIESSKPTENTEDSRAGVNPDKSIAKSCDESVNMMEPTVLIHESSSSYGEPSFQQQNQPYNRINRFSCSVCSQIFQSRSQMLRHQTLIHRSLKCEICACMFSSAEEVQNHKLAEHPSYNADMLAKKPHKCNVCGKGFPKHCRLVQHMAVHSTVPRQSSCDECGKYFPSPELLDIHKKTHETKEPSSGKDPLICGVCQRVFTKRSRLKRHMLLHESQSFPCNKCPKTFISRELLAEHQSIHSVEEEQGVSCTACGRVFTNKGRLKQHVAVHTKSGFVSCDNCFKVFANKQVLEMHAQTCANPNESSSSSQPATSSKSALTPPPPPSGFASCASCSKAFPTKNLLTEHEKTCVGLTVVKKMDGTWKVLDNEDRTRGATRSDMNSRSESLEEIKVFSCKICNKKFSNYHGLNSHMRFHQGIHKCDLCHKKFASRNELSQHMSSHSAVYRCGICSQAFGMVDELKKHVSQCMATQSGVASNYFSCNACSEVFSFQEELAEHVRCHAGEFPHVCTECFKVFAHSLQLSRHLATHFKEDQNIQNSKHICSICQKGFVNSGALDRHKVVHSGEKRFQCSYCFQRFSQRSSLNRHQLTQHETKS